MQKIQISSGAYGITIKFLLVLFDYERAGPVSAEPATLALQRLVKKVMCIRPGIYRILFYLPTASLCA